MSYMSGKDMLLLPDGATYHLGVKHGEIAPRIITVGSKSRAATIAKCLDEVDCVTESSRLMFTHTGTYKGVPVSIVAIGMGAPMMDFFVREASYAVGDVPMAVIRIGTCGLMDRDLPPGTVVTMGKGCTTTYINHAAWTNGTLGGQETDLKNQYLTSKPVMPNSDLNQKLFDCIKASGAQVFDGLNNASDTFYSCQGRKDAHFENGDNAHIIENFLKNDMASCEMESYTLVQLAKQRYIPMAATACHIGILNRVNDAITTIIGHDELHYLEREIGYAALDALVAFDIESMTK